MWTCGERRLHLLSHTVDAGLCAHVEREWMRLVAERFNFGNEWRKVVCFGGW